LREAHLGVRWHFEGAQLDETEAAGAAVGRVKFVDAELGAVRVAGHVDEQIAKEAIDQPRRHGALLGDLLEGQFQLVERIVARFVDARRLPLLARIDS